MYPYSIIPLTRGLVTIVDPEDYDWLSAWRWCAKPNGAGRWYAGRSMPRPRTTMLLMHRLILAPGPGLQVDHINGDGLDNRRANLRLATVSQNQANRGAPRQNTSGVKGVRWNGTQWDARITHDGVMQHLGRFDRLADAAAAYNAAAVALFGDYAWRPPTEQHEV